MEKLIRIQKRNNLNSVYKGDEPGPGGAHHDYVITREDNPDDVMAYIKFQKGARLDPQARQGVLDTDLLEIVRDRMKEFNQGEFATKENACALTHIEEALMWLNKRVEDRAERAVLGTYKK